MATYHPPVMITNNAAPSISADLMYEEHGKCGATRVIKGAVGENTFSANVEGIANAWKMVFLQDTKVLYFQASNMDAANSTRLAATYREGTEIMADIERVILDDRTPGLAILYLDCDQS